MNLCSPSDEVLRIVSHFDGPVTMVGDDVYYPRGSNDGPLAPGRKLILEWPVLDTEGLADYLRDRRRMIQ